MNAESVEPTRVQIGYVDFQGTGFSAQGVYFKDFTHNGSKMLRECWLVGDEFVVVTESGGQVIINKSMASAWTPLLELDWLRGEQKMPLNEQENLVKARAAKAAKAKERAVRQQAEGAA